MKKEEIMQMLPHRNSMLLIEEAEVMDEKAIGYYTIKGNEWFLDGHFPRNPVVPGVILCEMMAQTCSVLLQDNETIGKTPYFTGLDSVRFLRVIKPQEKLKFVCEITRRKGAFYFASGVGYVGEEKCVSGKFSFALKE